MVKVGTISESLEDYLEIIFHLLQEKQVARVRDIAERKNVKMPSVVGALRRLDEEGLINYSAHEQVELTQKGRELAHKVIERHDFLTRFLTDVLNVDREVAEEDACVMEHTISPETLERMVAFYGYVTSCVNVGNDFLKNFSRCCTSLDEAENGQKASSEKADNDNCQTTPDCLNETPAPSPHFCPGGRRGMGIGRGNGRGRHRDNWFNFKTLNMLQSGDQASVLRLRAPSSIRKRLIEMGILPGVTLEVVRTAPLGDPIEIKVKGYRLSIRKEEAACIDVLPSG